METLDELKITPEEAAAIRAEFKKIEPGLMEKHLVALRQEIRSLTPRAGERCCASRSRNHRPIPV